MNLSLYDFSVIRVAKDKKSINSLGKTTILHNSKNEIWSSLYEAYYIVMHETQLDKIQKINCDYKIVMRNDHGVEIT